MKCTYCGKETSVLSTIEEPICEDCAKEKMFMLCKESGKYIADCGFVCGYTCSDCDYSKPVGSE